MHTLNQSLPSSLLLLVPFLVLAGLVAPTGAAPTTAIWIIDDFTGSQEDHGITPFNEDQLEDLYGQMDRTEFTLIYTAVGEFSGGVKVLKLTVTKSTAILPAKPNLTGLPIQKAKEKKQQFMTAIERYREKVEGWETERETAKEGFIVEVMDLQMTLAALFAEKIKKGGKDYRHSDVAGAILLAAADLEATPAQKKILLLNTDCEDAPLGKSSREEPFKTTELSAKIELLFINSSGKPQKQPFFAGIPNKIHHADTIPNAIEQLAP